MKMIDGKYTIYGNPISKSQTTKATKWQNMFVEKFNYDPDEKYALSLEDNPYLGPLFGLKNIVRREGGEPVKNENAVICSTIRMGYGHYRIAMAGVSCARAMGFTALLAGSARHPGHHYRRDQPLQSQLQLLLAPLAAQQVL